MAMTRSESGFCFRFRAKTRASAITGTHHRNTVPQADAMSAAVAVATPECDQQQRGGEERDQQHAGEVDPAIGAPDG